MKSSITRSEVEMGHNSKNFAFTLCQEVGLPKTQATIGAPHWIPVAVDFPNKWLTYGNAEHTSGDVSIAHSMALGINLNCGFIPLKYTVIPINGIEMKCIMVVHGQFYGSKTNFTVANMHGDWDPTIGYKNPNNINAIMWFMRYMKMHLLQFGGHFVLAGDFNIDYENLCRIRNEVEKIIPNLVYPTIENKITSFVDGEYVCVDHIISNLDVEKISTILDARMSDHLMLAFKIHLPYEVRPCSIATIREPMFMEPNFINKLPEDNMAMLGYESALLKN